MKPDKEKSFGDLVFELRERLGITQEDVADFLGKSRQTVGEWESGKSKPSKRSIARHLEALQSYKKKGDQQERPSRVAEPSPDYRLGVLAEKARNAQRHMQFAIDEQARLIDGLTGLGSLPLNLIQDIVNEGAKPKALPKDVEPTEAQGGTPD